MFAALPFFLHLWRAEAKIHALQAVHCSTLAYLFCFACIDLYEAMLASHDMFIAFVICSNYMCQCKIVDINSCRKLQYGYQRTAISISSMRS